MDMKTIQSGATLANIETLKTITDLATEQINKIDELKMSIESVKRKLENPEINLGLFEKLCRELEYQESLLHDQQMIVEGILMTRNLLLEQL